MERWRRGELVVSRIHPHLRATPCLLKPRKRSPRGAMGGGNSSLKIGVFTSRNAWRSAMASRRRLTPSAAEPSATEPSPPSEAAADLVDKAKETARATAKALSSQASELAGNIGGELTETAEEQKGRGADAMRGFAKAVHGAANELDGQSPTVARYVRSAAESVEGLSDTIRSRNVRELVTAASDTARTHPDGLLHWRGGSWALPCPASSRVAPRSSAADSGSDGSLRRRIRSAVAAQADSRLMRAQLASGDGHELAARTPVQPSVSSPMHCLRSLFCFKPRCDWSAPNSARS